MSDNTEPVEVEGVLLRERDESYIVDFGDQEVVIPKSQIQEEHIRTVRGEDVITVTIPRWLARNERLI